MRIYKTICNHFLGGCTCIKWDKTSYLKHEMKMLYNLMMNIKNYKSNIVHENVDITIRNFHIHSEFHNHATINKHLDHNGTKFIWNKNLILPTNWFSKKKKSSTN